MQVARGRRPLTVLTVAAFYLLAARLSHGVEIFHGGGVTLWPPAGLGLASVVLLGAWAAPGITIAEFTSVLLEAHGHRPLLALAYAAAETACALLGAAILRRGHFNPQLRRIRDVLLLLLPAALAPALASATIATLAHLADGGHGAAAALFWRRWWLGDATGVVVAAPLVLTATAWLADERPRLPHGLRLLEGTSFLAGIGVLLTLTYLSPDWLAVALPTMLIWSALRFGPPGAALITAVCAGVGAMIAPRLSGSLEVLAPDERLLITQELFSLAALATLVLAAALAERERLLDTQDALGRFATAVANELPPDQLAAQIATGGHELLGTEVRVTHGGEPPDDPVRAPIDVHGERWGWITLPGLSERDRRTRFLNLDSMLPRFATLLGVGVSNTRARESLVRLAQTDPLTGLANGRVFHERLEEEMSRSRRYGRPVAVAMIDIDNFKAINDSVGHVGGDKVLAAVAERIAAAMRTDALVARLGGDEIAVILPESSAHGATIALQRARLSVSSTPVRPAGRVTISAGICDSTFADTPEGILELADDALYWSKLHGRDMAITYSPDVVRQMTEDERMHRLTRTRALVGLKALARVVDGRVPELAEHSERVATLAGKLAAAAGWQAELAEKLREAASVHDIGKLTLSADLIEGDSSLRDPEAEIWRRHPELGALMTADVLDHDQTGWIRWHHERADGGGYPDQLDAETLPEGAALIALADAWDHLRHPAPGEPPCEPQRALERCRAEQGRRFTVEAVSALERVLWEEAESSPEAIADRRSPGSSGT